jgi:hypothetical protein
MVLAPRELQISVQIRHNFEKVDSTDMLMAGIARSSRAILERTGKG